MIPKPKKKRSLTSYKNELNELFSLYVRLEKADPDGWVECYTCGKKKHYKEMQCGHFVPGRTLGILWETTNARPQCKACNVFLHGNLIEYYPKMQKEIGQEEIDRLKRLRKLPVKLSREWYETMIDTYDGYVSRRKSELGLN